jgi:hypothetical protein
MIAVGGMENISLVVHRQLPRIGSAPHGARPQGVVNVVLGSHFPGCAQATAQDRERAPNGARPQVVVNVVLGSEPILPHSVEVQDDWVDSELYPHASCSFNLTPVSESGSGALNGRCERCPPWGHKPCDCPNRGNVPKNECCGGYGKI